MSSLLAAFMCVPAAAQTAPEDQSSRPVSRAEGEAVVTAAWEVRKGLGDKPDCSHFVHAVYQRAGLDYTYANSRDIFDGIDGFRRVSRPQPGDLVVWPGHVGLVVDPQEHSFYSSVRSGFAIEDYQSAYWRHHGQPRFYRYLIEGDEPTQLQSQANPAEQAGNSAQRAAAHSKSTIDRHSGSPAESASGASPEQTGSESVVSDTEVMDAVFVSPRAKPSRDEIRVALRRAARTNGERAITVALRTPQAVAVADELAVLEVNTRGNSGWADIEIRQTASIQNGRANPGLRSERRRLVLRHQTDGWTLLLPRNKAFLPRDLATQLLAAHVERLSHEAENGLELKTAVRVLDDLLAGENRFLPVSGNE